MGNEEQWEECLEPGTKRARTLWAAMGGEKETSPVTLMASCCGFVEVTIKCKIIARSSMHLVDEPATDIRCLEVRLTSCSVYAYERWTKSYARALEGPQVPRRADIQ